MLAVLALVGAALPQGAQAQQQATIRAIQEKGFGRLILTFPGPTKVTLRATPGVVVLNFSDAVRLDVGKVPTDVPAYISAARTDPDGKGARFALAAAYDVNMMEAGEKVVVDFLPTDWAGLPPPLPQEIIEELAERARNTELRRAEERKARRIASAKPIPVRFGKLPTFTRMVFDWGKPTKARVERDEERVTIDFEHPGKIDTGLFKTQLPEWVTKIDSGYSDDGGLRVTLTVDPLSNVRGFPEEGTYVVDVTNPDWVGEASPLAGGLVEGGHKGGLDIAGDTLDEAVEPDGEEADSALAVTEEPFEAGGYQPATIDPQARRAAAGGRSGQGRSGRGRSGQDRSGYGRRRRAPGGRRHGRRRPGRRATGGGAAGRGRAMVAGTGRCDRPSGSGGDGSGRRGGKCRRFRTGR